ncbi:MAG TPA: hypothetical protein VJL59_24540 [Anaerolineales bacterium]|nr:hypothetical protein [Anaerolineales bacterium]
MLRKSALIILAFSLVACGAATPPPSEFTTGAFTISPAFTGFYESHGSLLLFGEPISAELDENGVTVQYFQNAKLEYHPQLPDGNQIILSSLGEAYYGRSPCVPPAGIEPNALYFNDCHSVSPEFRAFFEEQGGVAFFGYPISERYIFNGWLAQNFERAAIMWDGSKPVQYQFGLLPLGSLACPASRCDAGLRSAIPLPPVATPTPEPTSAGSISSFYIAHGGSRVFGLLLTSPRAGQDGALEQVYENAILYQNPAIPEGVSLRPLGLKALGAPELPAAKLNGPNTIFFTGYGHNVSYAMYDFFKAYGGEVVFGQPVSEWRIVDNHFVQYFENAVLTLRLDMPPDQSVQMVNLGRQALLGQSPSASALRSVPPQMLILVTEPVYDVLSPVDEQQTLKARVLDENGAPVAGAKAAFVVQTPGGNMEYVVDATDAQGYASYSFALTSFTPGNFMLYEVTVSYDRLSAKSGGSFVTWGNPSP